MEDNTACHISIQPSVDDSRFADQGQGVQALGEDAGRKVTGSNTQKAIRQFHVSNRGMPFDPVMILLGFSPQETTSEAHKKGVQKDSLHSEQKYRRQTTSISWGNKYIMR